MSNQFRKKPVVIEAVQYQGGGNFADPMLPAWLWEAFENGALVNRNGRLIVVTLEGEHLASPGDWIIRGVKGELYPCKPGIFAATYESADAPSASPPAPTGAETVPVAYYDGNKFYGSEMAAALDRAGPVRPVYYAASLPQWALTDERIEALIRIREHEPTILIEDEILGNYDEMRDEVWEAIQTYAEIHARAALQNYRAMLGASPCGR